MLPSQTALGFRNTSEERRGFILQWLHLLYPRSRADHSEAAKHVQFFVGWFLHPRCGNHWTIRLHLFGRVVFMLNMMITCKMKHLAIEIEDDGLNDDKWHGSFLKHLQPRSVKSYRIDPSSDTTLQLPVTPQSGLGPGSLLKLGFASVEIVEIMGFKIQDSGGYMFVSWIMFKNMRWNFNLWFVFKSKIAQTRYIFLLEKLGSLDILNDLSFKLLFCMHLRSPVTTESGTTTTACRECVGLIVGFVIRSEYINPGWTWYMLAK